MSASNNWAVSGAHTFNGRSIIAGDPHQPLRSPSVFWIHHLNSAERGGSLDLVGFNFVGSPGVQIGHNDRVVWTATINSPDMMDLWGVRVSGGNARIGDEERALERREIEVAVRDAEPQRFVIERVPGYGVLLPDDLSPLPIAGPGRRLLFNWTGFAPTNDFVSFLGLSTARTTDEFEAAIDTLEVGPFNWIAADRDSIAYVSSMWVPQRDADLAPRQPWMVLDGDDAASYWTRGMLPREWLPRSRGGARGWLATANADPYGFTADGDVTNDPFYFGAFYDPGTRAARAEAELARLVERGDVTLEDMEALQLDTHSRLADRLIALLERAWAEAETEEALAELRGRADLATLRELLGAWDRRMSRDSAAAVVYNALAYLFAERAIGDDLMLHRQIADASSVFVLKLAILAAEDAFEGGLALLQRGLADTMLNALADTAAWLEARFGTVDPAGYRWADAKVSSFRNDFGGRLDQGLVETDGGDGTLNVSEGSAYAEGAGLRDRIVSGSGAVYRMVATFAEDGVPEARLCFPPGNSGDPDSPFFANTLTDWVEGRYAPLRFRRADVEADVREQLVLRP
jgi:penicillin amidase